LTEAAVVALGDIKYGPAATLLIRLVKDGGGLRFLSILCATALGQILAGDAIGQLLPLLEQGGGYTFLDPYVGQILRLHDPTTLERRSALMNRIRGRHETWQRELDGRTVDQVFDEFADGCRAGRTELNQVAAIEAARIRLNDKDIAPFDFLCLWQERGYQRRQLGVSLDAYDLAEQWAIGGFWRRA
jgi:hypothetical protein